MRKAHGAAGAEAPSPPSTTRSLRKRQLASYSQEALSAKRRIDAEAAEAAAVAAENGAQRQRVLARAIETARLPAAQMTAWEQTCPSIPDELKADGSRYLWLRNHILLACAARLPAFSALDDVVREIRLSAALAAEDEDEDEEAGEEEINTKTEGNGAAKWELGVREDWIRGVYDALTHHGKINTAAVRGHPGFLAAAKLRSGPRNDPATRVLVIGAGFAGLAAAWTLQANGSQVVVIEGRDRVGGRVHTKRIGEIAVDLGAMVLTGQQGNPLADVCRAAQARMHRCTLKCNIYGAGGVRFSKSTDESAEENFNIDLVAAKQAAAGDAPDMSLATAMATGRHGRGGAVDSLYAWHESNLEYAVGAQLSAVSNRHWDSDDAYAFGGAHCLFPGGFGAAAQYLAEGLDVRYKLRVTKVEHGPDGVRVHASGPGNRTFQLRGKSAVITLPLGVLKSGAIVFDPPLPSEKAAAISRMGYGNLNKLVLVFSHPFWTELEGGAEFFGCARPPLDLRQCSAVP